MASEAVRGDEVQVPEVLEAGVVVSGWVEESPFSTVLELPRKRRGYPRYNI